jgi:hypothetical protein
MRSCSLAAVRTLDRQKRGAMGRLTLTLDLGRIFVPLAEALMRSSVGHNGSSHSSSPGEARFHQLPHVVSARAGDATVLMDREREIYFTLNEIGGRVWELVGDGATITEIVDQLAEEYDVSRPQLEVDVVATLQQLTRDQLVAPGGASDPISFGPVPRSPVSSAMEADELRVPSALRCGLLIAWLKGLLRIRGFMDTLEWIRCRIERVPATVAAELETVKAVEYAVAMAGALYPGRARCLEQSLALYYLLRRRGVAVKFCHGVQPYPFSAHVWIEYRGEVVNDVVEHAKRYVRLQEQLP